MTLQLAPDRAARRRLAAVATGAAPADLVVRGGALVDVYTDEILEGWGVAVAADRVALVGPDQDLPAGSATRVIELHGDLVAPGLVESHTHLVRASLREQVAAQVRAGVTTTVLESLEVALVGGVPAVAALLAEAAATEGRSFLTLGGLPVPDPLLEDRLPSAAAWARLLDHPLLAGVGELYWGEVLRGHARSEQLVEEALRRGLTAEGHGAGARHPSLAGLAALGASADHEGIDAADLRTRLRLGLWAEARHGATRQDLDAIAPLWQEAGGPGLGRLTLVCDGVEPEDLVDGRSLNSVVERARDLGLPLAAAIRMASLGPAERFGVGRWLGGLMPGAYADLQILPRQGALRPLLVLVGGREPRARPFERPEPVSGVGSATLPQGVLAPLGAGPWRAMRLVAPTVTREEETDGAEALWVLATDRRVPGRAFRGLLLGFGMRRGAVALSGGWEASGPILAGTDPAQLQLALERLRAQDGGAVVIEGGQVRAAWPAPIAGLLSPEPLATVAAQVRQVNNALRDLGAVTPNPLLTLETLTTTAIPFLRVTPEGYYRARDGTSTRLEVR